MLIYGQLRTGPTRLAAALSAIFASPQLAHAAPRPGLEPTLHSAPPNRVPTPSSMRMKGPRTLLVDDNDINLRLLQTFSKRLGISYESASDGLQALEAYKIAWSTAPFQYILLDITMPVMDGFEACRAIRQFEREQNAAKRKETGQWQSMTEDTKATIVALTGLNSSASQREAYSSGMDHFFTKPVRFQDLKKLILEGKSGGTARTTPLDGGAEADIKD